MPKQVLCCMYRASYCNVYINQRSVLLTKYCAGDKIEKNETGGACGMYGGRERCAQGFGGKPEGNGPLGRPRRRWEDNIKMDLEEVGRSCGDRWSWFRIGTGGGRL